MFANNKENRCCTDVNKRRSDWPNKKEWMNDHARDRLLISCQIVRSAVFRGTHSSALVSDCVFLLTDCFVSTVNVETPGRDNRGSAS